MRSLRPALRSPARTSAMTWLTWTGSRAQGIRLVLVLDVVLDMPHFVMNRLEVLLSDLSAHLDSEVLAVAEVPSGRVAHHFAAGDLLNQGFGAVRHPVGLQTHRLVKLVRYLKHPQCSIILDTNATCIRPLFEVLFDLSITIILFQVVISSILRL